MNNKKMETSGIGRPLEKREELADKFKQTEPEKITPNYSVQNYFVHSPSLKS